MTVNKPRATTRPRGRRASACEFTVPDDFDTMDQEEIEKLFYGDE